MPILVLDARASPIIHCTSIPAPWMFFLLAGQAGAALCLLMAVLQTDTLHFVGVRQLSTRPSPSELNTRGFYRLVRHPLYLFGLLFLWLTPIMSVNLLTVFIVLSIYLFVGASFEERRLLSEFGTQYDEYRQRTPMIIPGLRKAPRRRRARRGGRSRSIALGRFGTGRTAALLHARSTARDALGIIVA